MSTTYSCHRRVGILYIYNIIIPVFVYYYIKLFNTSVRKSLRNIWCVVRYPIKNHIKTCIENRGKGPYIILLKRASVKSVLL